MDRKSFFRGFGIGVLFTVAVLGISFMIRTSDTYVKSRAKELGMVYAPQTSDKVLASGEDVSASPESSPEASPAEKSTDAPKATDAPKDTQAPSSTKPSESTKAPKVTASPASKATKKPAASSNPSKKEIDMKKEREKMEKSVRDEEKKLTINAGEMSSDVSRKLQSLGIVKSAKDFDKYLEQHGYSSGISAGTYKVSKGDTYSQLARKITRR